jgi:PAS domain S-box-containing protein
MHNGDSAASKMDLALFYAFMDNNPAVAFMKNSEGRYVYVNKTFERLFDIPASKVLFTTDHDWFAPMVAEQNVEGDREVLETKQPLHTTSVVPTPDEVSMVWSVTKFPFQDANGEWYVGGVAIDVTPLHETTKELHDLVSVLQCQKGGLIEVNQYQEKMLLELHQKVQRNDARGAVRMAS